MAQADVNLAAGQDVRGDLVRQKRTLDRVSEVLCDTLDWTHPAEWWRRRAEWLDEQDAGTAILASKCRRIADLIEQENL